MFHALPQPEAGGLGAWSTVLPAPVVQIILGEACCMLHVWIIVLVIPEAYPISSIKYHNTELWSRIYVRVYPFITLLDVSTDWDHEICKAIWANPRMVCFTVITKCIYSTRNIPGREIWKYLPDSSFDVSIAGCYEVSVCGVSFLYASANIRETSVDFTTSTLYS